MTAILYQILIGDDDSFLCVFFFVPLNGFFIEGQYKINMVFAGSDILF